MAPTPTKPSSRKAVAIGIACLLGFSACSGGDADPATGTQVAANGESNMELTSTAFAHEGDIPERYTCDGDDVSPPLAVIGAPEGTASLVLVVDDPDAPGGTWDHWVVYDLPVEVDFVEGAEPPGVAGLNSWGRIGYGGPCPPDGTHRYFFKVYALDVELGLPPETDKAGVLEAMSDHVLAEATLMGRYG